MPKPTRTLERISLPGGWNFRHHNAFEYDYMLFRPTGKPQDYAGWTIAQAKAFAAAMNGQHYGVSRIIDPEYQAAQKELNRIRAAEVTALQSPAGEWRDIDTMPVQQSPVLVCYHHSDHVELAFKNEDGRVYSAEHGSRLACRAWMPLPPAPTGEVE